MMFIRGLLLVLCCLAAAGGLAGEGAPPATETVKLEYKFQPGIELSYTITGSAQQQIGGHDLSAKVSGNGRTLIYDRDAKTGVALVGVLASITVQGTSGGEDENHTERFALVKHVDRTGKVVPRQFDDLDNGTEKGLRKNVREELRDFKRGLQQLDDLGAFNAAALPAEAVKVGDHWYGLIRVSSLPLKANATYTLAELRVVDGRKLAVIKYYFTMAERNEKAMTLTGTGEGEALFYIDRGWMTEITAKIALTEGHGIKTALAVTQTLAEVSMVPATPPPNDISRFKVLDRAIDQFLAGETEEAMDALQKQRMAEKNEDWQNAFDQCLGIGRDIRNFSAPNYGGTLGEKPVAARAVADPVEFYKLADASTAAGETTKAVDAYWMFLASGSTDDKLRVLAQYRLAGLLEKLKQTPEATAAYKAVEVIPADDDYAKQIKEKARQKLDELNADR